MEIPDASKDDTADYKVVLTGEDDETVDSSCALTVTLPTLTITKGLEDQEAKVGDKVALGVEVSAPPKSVKWYKNGKEITSSDKVKPIKIDDNKYALEIPSASKEDTADYKVIKNLEKICRKMIKINMIWILI
ncbi:unnamed protein product [Gongylonema pulchrum]|uniref:Ig-like domain-containing protein n=1 Tax=Gongylonema pulchrum TaxID=637853 RepID=A0A3P6STL2_9BILA|nr:unnamed protein product [Gongylonema pulchrum]